MDIRLTSTWAEIASEVAASDPVGLLSCVDSFRVRQLHISFSRISELVVEIRPLGISVDEFNTSLATLPAAVLSSREMSVCLEGCVYSFDLKANRRLDNHETLLAGTRVGDSGDSEPLVTLRGFNKNMLPDVFGRPKRIQNFLNTNTSFSNSKIRRGARELLLEVIARDYRFENRPYLEDVLGRARDSGAAFFQREIPLKVSPLLTLNLYVDPFLDRQSLRFTQSGELHNRSVGWLAPIREVLKRKPGTVLEFDFPDATLGHFGDPLPHDVLFEAGLTAAEKLEELFESTSFKDYEKEVERDAVRRAAEKLHQRKDDFQQRPKIRADGKVIYTVPRNENETVALLHKLEGMGLVPLFRFDSLEYTAREGIDGLANFAIIPGDATKFVAAVEFEHKLSSFFAHGHPPQQSELIICWTNDMPESFQRGEKAWLYWMDIGSSRVPVIEISSFETIQIEGC